MVVMLGPGRADTLGIKLESMESRAKKIEKLDQPLKDLATFISEGHSMTEGLIFASGTDLAYYTFGVARFVVCALMEQGWLSKTLPKKASNGKDSTADGHHGTYL